MRRGLFETRAYFASLAVTAVMLPGAAGFTTSMLYVLHEKAGLTWWINRDGPRSFLYGTALTLVAWPLFALLFQRVGRVEGSNPTEYSRLRSSYAALRTRYEALRDDDLVFRRGLMWQRFTAVPYGRMQLVDVARGPLDRALGMSELKFVTAAAATNVRIPGIPAADADDLRDRLVELAESRRAGL